MHSPTLIWMLDLAVFLLTHYPTSVRNSRGYISTKNIGIVKEKMHHSGKYVIVVPRENDDGI